MACITRRRLLKGAGTVGAGAAAALSAPAIAQSSPSIRWRMATSWPRALDILYGGSERFAAFVAAATDNRFRIECLPSDDIAPGLQASEAAITGVVELCHTSAYYTWERDPTFGLACAVPFGLNGRMQAAWWGEGGGEGLINAFYAKHGLYGLLAGNTMAQMGGWFRREVNAPDGLRGLKMRLGDFAGAVMAKVGVVPQQLPGSETVRALQKGTLDAAEWIGPYDDEKLGLQNAARYYYYPGWWEGGAMLHVQVSRGKWEDLPPSYRAILRAAAAETGRYVVARYDALNPQALKRLIAGGTQLRPFSEAILDACYAAANELYAEISAKNEDFRTIWESLKAFRVDQYLWVQVAESSYDNFMIVQQRKHTL